MRVELFLAILFGVISVVLYLLVFLLYVRRRGASQRCTEWVFGTVVGPSAINYAGHHIPLVQYEVGGVTYKKAGPKFEGGTAIPGAQCNLVDGRNPPLRLVVPSLPLSANRMPVNRIYEISPISKVYPVGSHLEVWYDSASPKNAYVIRPVREGLVAVKVLLPLAIMFTVATVVAVCVA